MGGLLHLFDFNNTMAKKIFAQKKSDDGLEAPRNSLELTSDNYIADGDIPYSFPVEEDWCHKDVYPMEASMKNLINEEISKKPNSRQNQPSVVARLMGVETLPVDTKTERKIDETMKREKNGRKGVADFSLNSSRQIGVDSGFSYRDDKPKPREHPQEEELQKFKKEFEAWQAARLKECSKIVQLDSSTRQWLAQETLNDEKMQLYANSMDFDNQKPVEQKNVAVKSSFHNSRSRSASRDFEQPCLMNCNIKTDNTPTKIVILKPGPDRVHDLESSWTNSLGSPEIRGSNSIEEFLEEVKERLKRELQGKTVKKGSVVRGSGIETPYSEKPSDPKQIARHIAKHVRESVTRDIGTNLQRSESTRSYRTEVHFNSPGSPDYISKDTRQFLSERLRNVRGRTRSCVLDSETIRHDLNEWSNWEIEKDEKQMKTRSFRQGDDCGAVKRDSSPRNLIRSLSAPVSGTSFGQLLLEDRHILTGAHIRRKHEAIDNMSLDRRSKRERFNFKEKVSNFRYSFALRRMLFGKKFQLQAMTDSYNAEYDHLKDIANGPSGVMNFSERLENSTEVPPSPASVCSSSYEDFWRPNDYLSPVSTPDVGVGDDNTMPQVFREISSNLSELRRQLNELESDYRPDDLTNNQDNTSEINDLDDKAEEYIRDLLINSGFYDGTSEQILPRWDPLAKPITSSVFNKVEESYRKSNNTTSKDDQDHHHHITDRKLLLDLLNEALSTLIGPPVSMSIFMRKINGYSPLQPPTGRKLLDSVWEVIRAYLYPPMNRMFYSLDRLVAEDFASVPWFGLIEEELTGLGKEVECLILKDLIDETFKDLIQNEGQ